jgi:alpha-glucosidase
MQKNILLLLFLLSNLAIMAQSSSVISIGNFESSEKSENSLLIKATNAQMKISVFAPDIVRVQVAQGQNNVFDDFSYAVIQQAQAKYQFSEDKDAVMLETEKLKIRVEKSHLKVIFMNKEGKIINQDDDLATTWLGTEVTTYKKMFADEKFIGLGEKTGNLNRRGNAYTHWNSDKPAYALNEDPLYKTLPFYIGIHDKFTYGIFMDNSHKSTFDFGASTDDQFMRFSAVDGQMNYYFLGADNVAELIEDYTWLTGRMQLPPLWSLGYQQCRWSYYPDKEVLNLAKTFRDKKIPADVIYLDINYMDSYKIFTFHPTDFPKPQEMVAELNKMGFHVVVIVDPGIKIENGYKQYEDGVKNDYFVKYPSGKLYIGSVWPGRCHFPDFTKAGVRDWWGKQFETYTSKGIEGFWNDMNEPAAWGQNIPNIVQFNFDGKKTTLNQARNVYGLQMSRATSEGSKALMNNKRNFVLTRAAYSGIQRYSAVWTGDNLASDDHMLLGCRLVNSLGLTGVAFAGPDVGGFMGETSKELYQRWLSIGVFTPFFRGHSEIGSKDKEPWAFGEWVEASSRNELNLRYKLLPYLYSSFYQAATKGTPVARSLAINYTFDEKIYYWDYQNQYLFGDNFLVAPVSSKDKYLKVYLPEGNWYRFSSDAFYTGKQEVIVDAPLGDLPVFVRAGAIIPMQSVVQYTAEKPSEILNIHIYNGKNTTTFQYYEDDGSTYNHEKGEFYLRNMTFSGENKTLSFSKVEGKSVSKFTKYRLVLHGFEGEVSGFSATKEGNTYIKEIDAKSEAFEVKW